MSQECYLVCHQCKKKVHIACEGFSGFQFWRGDETVMKKAHLLLENCIHHIDKLGFAWEQSEADEEYEEI